MAPAFVIATGLLLHCPSARADPAAAEVLFREARALLAQGEVAVACEKLEASQALEPSSGTLLNLAACRLKQGKTATAWAYFVAAGRLALSQNRPEQAGEAERRAAELEAKLSYLTLRVSEPPPGLEVRSDGQVVSPVNFGMPIPLDPGEHSFEASAPGFERVRVAVTLSASGENRVLELPRLQKLPPVAGDAAYLAGRGEQLPRDGSPGAGPWPWVLGGLGTAGLVTGGVFGALALSSNAKAKGLCEHRTDCSDAALAAAERRDRQALISTVGVSVGLVGVGIAATLWLLRSGSAKETAAHFADAELTREGGLIRVEAAF